MANSFGWKALIINVIALLVCNLGPVCGLLQKDFKNVSILHYDFEQTNGSRQVIDRSGNGRYATMDNGIKSIQGKCGEGIALATESLRVNTGSPFNPENKTSFEITIATWIFLNETKRERTIFSSFHNNETGGEKKPFLYFGIKADNMFRFSATSKHAVKNTFKSISLTLKPRVWQNIGASYRFINGQETCIFFLNGKQFEGKHPKKPTKAKMSVDYPPLGHAAVIGSNDDGPFLMDQFYIFDTAFFPEEIQRLMNDTCNANPTISTTAEPTKPPVETYTSTRTTTKMITFPTYQATSAHATTLKPRVIPASTMSTLENIEYLLDEFTASNNISTAKGDEGHKAMGITRELERNGLKKAQTLKPNESVSLEATSALFLIKRPYAGFTFPHADDQKAKNIKESMSFPDEMVKAENGVLRAFVCISYTNIHESMPPVFRISSSLFKPSSTFTLNSKIIGSAVSPPLEKPLINPINITFSHAKISSGKQVCSFWNHSIRTIDGKYGSWATSGCKLDEEHSTSTKTVCLCDHLTNFALLLQREGAPYSEPPLSLKIITIIGCSLSILACLLCFIMFFTLKKKDIRHYLHINLTFAIAVAQLILLFGITQTEYKILCKAMAACLHYFYLVAFLLMLCEGVHLAILIESAFSHGDLKLPTYLITSWGLPLVIVGITLGARFDNYGSSNACFISADQGTVYAFVGPFALILVINFVILVIVLRHVVRKTSLPISAKTASNFEIARATIRSLVILFPVMGFTWVFGILYFGFRSLALEYLFAIFCSLQGFFIFLLQYALNTENRAAFARATRRWRLTLTSSLNSSANPTKKTGAPSVKISPPDSKENSQEMHTSTVDNCHLMLYRNVDNNGSGTLDSRTTSTFI